MICRSCPALQHLVVLAVAEGVPASDLAPLLQLTELTHLGIGGAGCDDAAADQVLAKLTAGLQELAVWCSPSFTAGGLAHLTALTALTSLHVDGANTRFHKSNPSTEPGVFLGSAHKQRVDLKLQAYGNTYKPVWQQLKQLCTRSPSGLAVMKEHAQQQSQAEQLPQQQQQQLPQQQQQLPQQQQQQQ
uniref:Uncharacterized protein n=1 Tax=Tetradesmus obliquus TaxID=3088 RepID=A0A383VER3_TETOB|eukprot:jgi/Sobl393_1/16237/SZX64045.1